MSTSEPMTDKGEAWPAVARTMGTALGLGVSAAAMWFAWLGWDNEYYQVNGETAGPYREWQVLGCGAAITFAAVAAYLWIRNESAILLLPAAATLGLAIPWAVDTASSDDSGLWVVGLLFLLGGVGAGLAVLLVITAAIAGRSRPSVRRSS